VIAGHAPLAFALAGLGASALGHSRRRALAIAVAAGAFALIPDVDILHAVVGFFGSMPADAWRVNDVFWAESHEAHRGITHSLALGVPAALGFGSLAGGRRYRATGGALLLALAVTGFVLGGLLGFAMVALYALAGLGAVALARGLGLGMPATIAAAAVGLGSHPFGDLFTGTPPELLYPIRVGGTPERIALLADPTLNLLAVFGLELAAVWLGLLVAARLLDRSLRRYVEPHAALGVGYGAAALVLPTPSLEVAAPFALSVVAVGGVGIAPVARRARRIDRERLSRGLVTGVAAVTLAGVGYTVAYVLL
jgi:membrane-bound metal-dependent hydrolase YbcI (DUF457 family)